MPFLDAKALDVDPEGMAFLRSVIRPNFEREEVASASVPKQAQPLEAASAKSSKEAEVPPPVAVAEAVALPAV